ncbi:MAG: hypothetical protein MUF64_32545, partial [Polyangiaceae bacterium]|nr:hypothetical protein [Polyangiaceae bacterium]
LLADGMEDALGPARRLKKPERAANERLRAIEDAVESGEVPDRAELYWFAEYLREASRAGEFLAVMRREIHTWISSGVALPVRPLSAGSLVQLRHVAGLLGHMVRADSIVRAEELSLAHDLLDDFAATFFFSAAGSEPHELLETTAHGEREAALDASSVLPPPARRWVWNALRSLMAVDREVHADELELLRKMRLC